MTNEEFDFLAIQIERYKRVLQKVTDRYLKLFQDFTEEADKRAQEESAKNPPVKKRGRPKKYEPTKYDLDTIE